jgi:hypothetical protein
MTQTRRWLAGLVLGAALAVLPVIAAADHIAEWCEVDPDVLRVDGATYHVRYEVQQGDQHRVHELVAYVNPGGQIKVEAPADLEYRYTVVLVG